MNLSEMREKYKRQLTGLAEGQSTGQIDEALTGAYRYTLPHLIKGEMLEGEWALQLVVGQESYPLPVYVHAVRPGCKIDDRDVDTYTRPPVFWTAYNRSNDAQARPCALLAYGRTVTFRPIPGDTTIAYIPVRQGPAADLDSDGIEDRNHAMCVLLLAALEYADDFDLTETKAKIEKRLPTYLTPLMRLSNTRGNARAQQRDF